MNHKFYTTVLLFSILMQSCISQEQPESLVKEDMPDFIYPKYRRWMSPDNNITARFSSPSLEWPSDKSSLYDVRIATDPEFKNELIEINDIPFSLINPHQNLKKGLWYWQYKSKISSWSDAASFVVNDETISFVPPAVNEVLAGIGKAHPRVLIEKENLSQFLKKSKNYKEREKIIAAADLVLTLRIPEEEDAKATFEGRDRSETEKIKKQFSQKIGIQFGKSLETLTKAFVLTQDEKYFNTARKWMLQAALWDPKGLTHINDFGDAYIMESLALAIDVFWEKFEESERQSVVNQIVVRGDGFYDNWTNYVENRNSSMHVWQHIFHRLFISSIALVNEVPEASKWFTYLYELWIAQHPKMGVEDGAWFNGTGYMRMNVMTLLDVPMRLGDFTGLDFFVSPWYENFMTWMSYSYPPGSTSDGFCNDGKKWPIPNIEYGAFSDAIARVLKDPYARSYSDQVFDTLGNLEEPYIDLDYTGDALVKSKLSDDKNYAWFRMTRGYDMELPETDGNTALRDAAIFRDVGVAYLNSDRNNIDKNLMVSVKSSPMGPLAHTHAEQNNFNIAYKGKRLFYNSGYRPWMGSPHQQAWHKHTQGHNTILVDGQGQPYDSGAYGFLPRFMEGDQLSYVVGDASHAYESHELSQRVRKDKTPDDMGVKKFRRHFILLKPDILIVYDVLEAEKPVDWSWLIHNYHGLKLDAENKTVETTYEDRGGRVTLFGGSQISYDVTDKFTVEPFNFIKKLNAKGELVTYKNHWHFKATTKEKQEKMKFLAVIQVSDNLEYSVVVPSEKGVYEILDWKITANMDVNAPARIKVEKNDGSLEFISHLETSDGLESNQKEGLSRLIEFIGGDKHINTAGDVYPKSILNALTR